MRVLLTAGGTREPVDDVRVLANTSTGRLGAQLADAFVDAGHPVVLLHAQGAARPSQPGVERHVFGASSELWTLMQRQLPDAEVVLHAAAVSDYLPVRAPGKLSSDADELVLRLTRAPKLIDRLRAHAPAAFLVGFKLTSGRDRAQRVSLARGLAERAQLDLVVANDARHTGDQDHEALLVTADDVRHVGGGKAALARALVDAVCGARRLAAP
ncbi:MAG: DNA/pantothenate metabolism flavoprotein [Planctomycetota bacterium]|nr:MAG: DNA/pantothenate metabolism flavoprotein [Planctomycetota bacterium]